jgi:hypothetical protein
MRALACGHEPKHHPLSPSTLAHRRLLLAGGIVLALAVSSWSRRIA